MPTKDRKYRTIENFGNADRFYFFIEEDLVDSLGTRRQVPWFDSQLADSRPSGLLTFSFKTKQYGSSDAGQWCETAKLPLERVLSQIVTAIRQHYLDIQIRRAQEAVDQAKRHVEWERQHREWLAQEAIRLQKEKERKHTEALEAVARTRKEDLSKAAERWRMSCGLVEFVNECERRWKNAPGEITAERKAWLRWARDYAEELSPFVTDYPNPVNDGAFDPATVPFGGPYPPTRNFSCR